MLVVLFVVGALLPLRVASPGRCGTLARAASGAHEAPDSEENPCRCCLVRSLQLCRHRNPLKRDTDRAHRERANEERQEEREEEGDMSVPPVSSNVHGQLDAQIAQLTQCKPLPEHEVCVCYVVCVGMISGWWFWSFRCFGRK